MQERIRLLKKVSCFQATEVVQAVDLRLAEDLPQALEVDTTKRSSRYEKPFRRLAIR